MTSNELRELLRLAEAATPGPWETEYGDWWRAGTSVVRVCVVVPPGTDKDDEESCWRREQEWLIHEREAPDADPDTEFIAAANPTTVAALVREVMRLRGANDELLSLHKGCHPTMKQYEADLEATEVAAAQMIAEAVAAERVACSKEVMRHPTAECAAEAIRTRGEVQKPEGALDKFTKSPGFPAALAEAEAEIIAAEEREACIEAIAALEPVDDPPGIGNAQATALNDAIAAIRARGGEEQG